MQRFYIPDVEIKNKTFVITDETLVFQLVKVLRSQIGEQIIVFDGITQKDFVCEITGISKKSVELDLIQEILKESESSLELNLFQALPNKLEKIEYILQKGVEVGVSKFFFFRSERSQKCVISENKEERLRKIIIEAVEQSGRNYVPELEFQRVGDEYIHPLQGDSIFLHTQSKNAISLKKLVMNYEDVQRAEALCGPAVINLYIGPEGGFSPSEVEIFEKNNFERVHLGNRILRTETAGVVTAFSLLQMLELR